MRYFSIIGGNRSVNSKEPSTTGVPSVPFTDPAPLPKWKARTVDSFSSRSRQPGRSCL